MIFLVGDRVRIRIRKKHKEYSVPSIRRWNGKTGQIISWHYAGPGEYAYTVRLGPTNYRKFHGRVLNFLESKEEIIIRQEARKAELGLDKK